MLSEIGHHGKKEAEIVGEFAALMKQNLVLMNFHQGSFRALTTFAFLWAGIALSAVLNIPDNVVFERDIEYANPDGQHLQLNLARPKEASGSIPAVLCIHGGGFRAGSRDGYNALCLKLAEHGFVAVTVTYRLAPKYQFPAAIHDVKAA